MCDKCNADCEDWTVLCGKCSTEIENLRTQVENLRVEHERMVVERDQLRASVVTLKKEKDEIKARYGAESGIVRAIIAEKECDRLKGEIEYAHAAVEGVRLLRIQVAEGIQAALDRDSALLDWWEERQKMERLATAAREGIEIIEEIVCMNGFHEYPVEEKECPECSKRARVLDALKAAIEGEGA